MSRCLSDRAIDHVVLERGRVAERWRSERWDSLRLLTPNWQTRLPGFRYDGPEPDGYMSMPELIRLFERYAQSFDAPVEERTTVLSVSRSGSRFFVDTDRGSWRPRNVVIATGHSDLPFVPPMAARMSERIVQIVPSEYRNPGQLPEGGVLVVGASATGVQLADEIHASGRSVTLAVGRHLRMPRTYRGRDILWWLDAMGAFDDTADDVFDITASREQPSLQLVGRATPRWLDVRLLHEHGVSLLGHLIEVEGERLTFDDDLVATTAAADIKLAQTLQRIDAFVTRSGMQEAGDPEPFEPTWPLAYDVARTTLDLSRAGIETVIWATGFTRRYPWVHVPILDSRGEILHRGGITPIPGVFVLGMHFQRRRNSAFIDGVGRDAAFLAERIARRSPCGAGAHAPSGSELTWPKTYRV